ncbi:hypothetical protein BRY73_06785 [Ochrobactrum sp. P6BS-III]|uniref:hypothetical protein n=1 Tax=unclassified Ochrobactrum TaxID=239106 RepID=UPI0009938015|nr:hypothetical protein [Ochrobactrum sp. P6BSIII]OOL18656.1 hypothetical protein BRY73_06785 [Ochrobactrum sp. P6BS-III]
MLSRFIAISLTIAGLPVVASANGAEPARTTYEVGSIDYIGYDRMGANGLPVCGTCNQRQEAEAEALKEIEARRKRARAYMARMQGKPLPEDAQEQPAATPAASPTEQKMPDFDPAKPVRVVGEPWAGASGEVDLSSLALRPSLQ